MKNQDDMAQRHVIFEERNFVDNNANEITNHLLDYSAELETRKIFP